MGAFLFSFSLSLHLNLFFLLLPLNWHTRCLLTLHWNIIAIAKTVGHNQSTNSPFGEICNREKIYFCSSWISHLGKFNIEFWLKHKCLCLYLPNGILKQTAEWYFTTDSRMVFYNRQLYNDRQKVSSWQMTINTNM